MLPTSQRNVKSGREFALCAGRRCAERTEGKTLVYDELYVLVV
jgi:hypothetical protein